MKINKMRPALEQLKNKHNLIGAEIGVYHGIYALVYLKELDIKKIFLVDSYCTYGGYGKRYPSGVFEDAEKEAHEKLEVYKNKITWIKAKSAKAIDMFEDESLDFVYIDANHQYQFVLEDMTLYYPKVKKGGLFSGHDYKPWRRGHGVVAAVGKFCKNNGFKLTLCTSGADWWIWKE